MHIHPAQPAAPEPPCFQQFQAAGGAMVTGAALAAIALEYGAALASTDQDLRRFPGLRWVNPLS